MNRGASFTANGPSCFGADRYLPLFWARFARQVMLRLAPLAATRFARHPTAPLEKYLPMLMLQQVELQE